MTFICCDEQTDHTYIGGYRNQCRLARTGQLQNVANTLRWSKIHDHFCDNDAIKIDRVNATCTSITGKPGYCKVFTARTEYNRTSTASTSLRRCRHHRRHSHCSRHQVPTSSPWKTSISDRRAHVTQRLRRSSTMACEWCDVINTAVDCSLIATVHIAYNHPKQNLSTPCHEWKRRISMNCTFTAFWK